MTDTQPGHLKAQGFYQLHLRSASLSPGTCWFTTSASHGHFSAKGSFTAEIHLDFKEPFTKFKTAPSLSFPYWFTFQEDATWTLFPMQMITNFLVYLNSFKTSAVNITLPLFSSRPDPVLRYYILSEISSMYLQLQTKKQIP